MMLPLCIRSIVFYKLIKKQLEHLETVGDADRSFFPLLNRSWND